MYEVCESQSKEELKIEEDFDDELKISFQNP